MNVVGDDGMVLDARFSVEGQPLSLVYESAGGRTGVNARNRDYGRGLELILSRLADIGAVLTDIRVDSVVTRRLPPDQQRVVLRRHQLPIALAKIGDFGSLKRDISTAAREPGAREGSSRGGSSRRLRFLLEAGERSESDLEHAVAGAGAIPEADAVRTIVDVAAGRRSYTAQGFLLSPKIKRAVELHSMDRAIAYYSRRWKVTDVHANHPFDLECRRGSDVLYVEVKGSTTRGDAVIVTPNEVKHARTHHPHTELFVLSEIVVDDAATTSPHARGGKESRHSGWGTDDSRLRPVGFEYRIKKD